MFDLWQRIINNIRSDPRDLHTLPKTNKQPLWFYVYSDGSDIYVSNARGHKPSSALSSTRKLSYSEFEKMYPLYLRREHGESVSREATQTTINQVYWYSVIRHCLSENNIMKRSTPVDIPASSLYPKQDSVETSHTLSDSLSSGEDVMNVFGYKFTYIQRLIPERYPDGRIKEYFPQSSYDNVNNLPLLAYGEGSFCKFSVHCSPAPGVYLWVLSDEIIYIGETADLKQRFNQGYGNISPRNCYTGGQSTNCKMNKVVLKYASEGKAIKIYFYQTTHHKEIELKLLRSMRTQYNTKDSNDRIT